MLMLDFEYHNYVGNALRSNDFFAVLSSFEPRETPGLKRLITSCDFGIMKSHQTKV